MRLQSLYNKDLSLSPMDVQVHLVPGPPEVRILGLPDAATKESGVRVKAAIRACGFEFPAARTVLVQLSPASERKSSRGLDLAIAAGILWEMEQVPAPQAPWLLYGELSFTGDVTTPRDFAVWNGDCEVNAICTGADAEGLVPSHFGVQKLLDLTSPQQLNQRQPRGWCRPQPSKDVLLTQTSSRLLEIVAVGGHSVLLAGPPGSGKTSTLDVLPLVAPPPPDEEGDWLRRFHWMLHSEERWHRPLIAPHHSVSQVALVGGGQPPKPGEVTRAHGGFLLLDEFLEFSASSIEALREPLENRKVRVSKGFSASEFPAAFHLLATTNLCPCGRFVPGKDAGCVCGARRRRQYLARLNGPVLDRLDILTFTDGWGMEERTVPVLEVIARIDKALEYKARWQQAQREAGDSTFGPDIPEHMFKKVGFGDANRNTQISWRRKNALRRVAQSIAFLKGEEKVSGLAFCEAVELAVIPFQRLLRALQG